MTDEAAFRVAEIVRARMLDEGGGVADIEEYVDDLIAFSRGNHPEFDDDERWRRIRAEVIPMVKVLFAEEN